MKKLERIKANPYWRLQELVYVIAGNTGICSEAVEGIIGSCFSIIHERLAARPDSVVSIDGLGKFFARKWESRVVVQQMMQEAFRAPARYNIYFKYTYHPEEAGLALTNNTERTKSYLERMTYWSTPELARMISFSTNISYRSSLIVLVELAKAIYEHLYEQPGKVKIAWYGVFSSALRKRMDYSLHGKPCRVHSPYRVAYKSYDVYVIGKGWMRRKRIAEPENE